MVPRLLSLAWLTLAFAAMAASGHAQVLASHVEDTARIEPLIQGLDDVSFAVRQRSERELVAGGRMALPAVLAAMRSDSAEVRSRAARIAAQIRGRLIGAGFADLARKRRTLDDVRGQGPEDLLLLQARRAAADQRLDLEQGMWLISLFLDPQVRREDLDLQLDALAERVQARLGSGVDARLADPRLVVDALRQVLFVEEGFSGNTIVYDDPDNSSLARVLATRKGLPILLSHVTVAVADRVGAPIVGLAVPLRYMVKYDGARAPRGYPAEDIILDPFGGGRVLTVEEVAEAVAGLGAPLHPERDLLPATHRATIERMLSNLVVDLRVARRPREALEAAQFKALFAADEVTVP